MISRECLCCSSPFDVPYPSYRKTFCSYTCSAKAKAAARGGLRDRNHPQWRGGISRHPLYHIWQAMKDRCLNPRNSRYRHYGGRGITVCPQWVNSFEQFLADVGEKPSPELSIDRIDNDGNYEPGNVRWATKSQQSANTRRRASAAVERVCPECGGAFMVKNPSRPNVYCSKPCAGRVRARNRGFNVGPLALRKPKIRKTRKKAT